MSFFYCAESRGTLLCCSTTHRGENSIVRHRLREREGVWSFQTTPCPAPPLPSRVIALQTALDRSRGTAVTFLVSQRAPSNHFDIRSLTCTPSTDLIPHGTLHVRSSIEKNLTILHGPTVVWGERNRVCVALPEAEAGCRTFTRREIHLSRFFSGAAVCVEKLWSLDCPHDSLLLLIRCSSSTQSGEKSKSQWCCLSVKRGGGGGGGGLDVQLLPSHCCVPQDYGYVATCVGVCQFWMVGRGGDVCSETHLLVGTSYGQVVLLRGGIPVHCVAMETTPIKLHVLQVCGGEEVIVVVVSGDGQVKAYRLTSSGKTAPKEEGSWVGVAEALVGDFANLNREQLLLLLSSDERGVVGEFVLTDFCGFTAASGGQGGARGGVANGEVAESLVSAAEGLRRRQQRGEAHLMQLERQLQEKSRLLRDGLLLVASIPLAHHHLSPPPPPPSRDLSLVCLLPGKIDNKVGVADVDSAHSAPVVTGCWQRVLDGYWVVGVVLKNNTNSVWRRVSLGLNVEELPVVERGESKLVWISEREGEGGCQHPARSEGTGRRSAEPPASKRARTEELLERVLKEAEVGKVTGLLWQRSVPHGDSACLVSRVPLPSVAEWNQISGVVRAGLVVTWRRWGSGRRGEGVRVVEVGRVELSRRQLAHGGLQCDWEDSLRLWDGGDMLGGGVGDFSQRALQDLSCLLATQHISHLKLSSHYSDLTCLADTLRTRMPLSSQHILPRPRSIPSQTWNGSLESDQRSLSELEKVFLYVSDGQTNTATISVLHKNPPCLSVVMSAIQNCLPDDVTLSPTHLPCSPSSHITSEVTQAIRQCVAAVRRELELKRETVEREMEEEEEEEELLAAAEETDFAMFRAMQSLDL